MNKQMYTWGGEFTLCNHNSCIAVVLLNTDFIPPDSVAVYGFLKTENIGIEKLIANVISNPNIRFVIICGDDIRGHKSGSSLISLYENGINDNHRIIDAPGAIPYIENIDEDAINRFKKQVQIIDLIGLSDHDKINETIKKCLNKNPDSFGKPYIAIQIKQIKKHKLDDKRALHSKIIIDYIGNIKKRK